MKGCGQPQDIRQEEDGCQESCIGQSFFHIIEADKLGRQAVTM
jgi:hypothetical protein